MYAASLTHNFFLHGMSISSFCGFELNRSIVCFFDAFVGRMLRGRDRLEWHWLEGHWKEELLFSHSAIGMAAIEWISCGGFWS